MNETHPHSFNAAAGSQVLKIELGHINMACSRIAMQNGLKGDRVHVELDFISSRRLGVCQTRIKLRERLVTHERHVFFVPGAAETEPKGVGPNWNSG